MILNTSLLIPLKHEIEKARKRILNSIKRKYFRDFVDLRVFVVKSSFFLIDLPLLSLLSLRFIVLVSLG
jgi:hypothetical protein